MAIQEEKARKESPEREEFKEKSAKGARGGLLTVQWRGILGLDAEERE